MNIFSAERVSEKRGQRFVRTWASWLFGIAALLAGAAHGNGMPDPSFGSNGTVPVVGIPAGMTVLADDTILVLGTQADANDDPVATVESFVPETGTSATFGGGRFVLPNGGLVQGHRARDAVQLQGGNVAVVGTKFVRPLPGAPARNEGMVFLLSPLGGLLAQGANPSTSRETEYFSVTAFQSVCHRRRHIAAWRRQCVRARVG